MHVKNLFAKYTRTLQAPQKTVIQSFIAATEDALKYSISPQQCSYSVHTRTLTVSVSGVVKTEILFKKKEILAVMKSMLGPRNVPKEIL